MVFGLATLGELPDDRTRIVYALARPEPGGGPLERRTKDVPTEWHRQLELAFDVQDKLGDADLSSLVGSFVVPGSYDDPTASLAVDATDDGIRDTLAELAQDVAIDLDVVSEIPPASDDEPTLADAHEVTDLDRKRVPGGYVCTTDGAFGTLAPALYDQHDGTGFFATSNHLYGAGGAKETEHAGEPLSLQRDTESRPIGRVVRGYPRADVVRVAPVDGYRPVPEIARADPGVVIGQYTKLGLADLMARGEPLVKVGALSDLSTGRIKGIDGVTCYTGEICKPGQLKWGSEESIVDGDSGSVSFHADPDHPEDYVLVAGFNNARTWWPGMDFSWGTAMYQLYGEFGIHV